MGGQAAEGVWPGWYGLEHMMHLWIEALEFNSKLLSGKVGWFVLSGP